MLNINLNKIPTLLILSVLAFSTIIPALAYAAPRGVSDKDWTYVNANTWAWNYSPQTQITKNNVQQMEIKWVFPVASKELAPAGIKSLTLNEGVATPVLIRNGMAFFTTNWLRTYALDAKTGKELWTNDYTIDVNTLQKRLPLKIGSVHLHAIGYWEGGEAVLVNGMACDFTVIDAKTGKEKLRAGDLCQNVPGNVYPYSPAGASIASIGVYEGARQFIYSLNGNTAAWNAFGRNVVMGINADNGQVIWRVFNQPPQDRQVKDWALEECDAGFFRTTPCSEVAAKARQNLEWDWTVPGEVPSKWGGVGSNWGQPVIDEDTGLLYMNTGNQSPYTNVSLTPGPRLYGSTIMAIDMKAGKRVWWLQPMPHDPYDYDCNWNGVLAETTQLGKVYVKGCKEGILFAMDAKTGKPKWNVDVHEEIYPGKKNYHLTDPFDMYDMREWKTPENSKYHGKPPILLYPGWLEGTFGTDISYDPQTQTLFHYAQLTGVSFSSTSLSEGKGATASTYVSIGNTTIVARDINTGQVKWKWFYQFSAQRSHIVVLNDMIFSGFTDGYVKFFDKNTGQLLNQLSVGSGIFVGPTIGKDSDGKQKILLSMGGIPVIGGRAAAYAGGAIVPVVPGTIIALGLSDRAPQITTTTVTSQVTETVGLPSEVTYAAVAVAIIAIIAAAVLTMRKRA